MARRLRKKRIAVILLTFTAIIVWTTHSCVSRCTSSGEKEKAEDTLPKAHINDSISNALSEGKEYQELDSMIERNAGKSMGHSSLSPATTPYSTPVDSDGQTRSGASRWSLTC